ncbi:ChaN family lipoprotein [Telmatospirillum siberiense]|uniref:Haem-binding uptake Tiki superfamily ChaN domain-containing protein n=1 Tax=Telmatospirillum siberiense TaxID=382514 RepID=A0A2N3PM12_9PROT|nr:ChaN family lipoprotein [Telmatospirillum siberiense]PKU21430.1 hypothetical protein CWS72_26800 [Telmatospirillum siberiense]
MRSLFAVLVLLITLPSCVSHDGDTWSAPLDRDHPLVGRIWLPAAQRFIDRTELSEQLVQADIVLLGERHDNPDHHRLQAWALARVIAAGGKPRLAFEMIGPEQTEALERHLREQPGDVDGLADALDWTHGNWPDWKNYQPLFAEGVAAGLDIRAANLSRDTVRAVARGQALADEARHFYRLDQPLAPAIFDAMAVEIRQSHCGQLPEQAVAPMVDVQRARDAAMAHALIDGAPPKAVLIAGAGHTRIDRGVPSQIDAMTSGKKVFSLAFIEVDEDWTAPAAYGEPYGSSLPPYDAVWFTPRANDDDPCAEMINFMKKKREQAEGTSNTQSR